MKYANNAYSVILNKKQHSEVPREIVKAWLSPFSQCKYIWAAYLGHCLKCCIDVLEKDEVDEVLVFVRSRGAAALLLSSLSLEKTSIRFKCDTI
jgi:hypothetical protein